MFVVLDCVCCAGMCLLCWIVVAVVNVGPCTCMYQVLLLSWSAQATLHQLSCDHVAGADRDVRREVPASG